MGALHARAGGAVTGVADVVVAGELRYGGRGEHVGHQAGVLVHAHPAAVADGDTRGLLAAMLQREQPEEGELGDALTVRRGDGEHAALLTWLVAAERAGGGERVVRGHRAAKGHGGGAL